MLYNQIEWNLTALEVAAFMLYLKKRLWLSSESRMTPSGQTSFKNRSTKHHLFVSQPIYKQLIKFQSA